MKKIHMMIAVLLAMVCCGNMAGAGVASEALEFLLRRVGTVADDAGRLLVKEAQHTSSAIARLVTQYGDDAIVTLAKNPKRVQLVERLGDDAAEALLKHNSIAEEVLLRCPDYQVANALSDISRRNGQLLDICASRANNLTNEQYKNLVLIVKEGGDDVAEKLCKMKPDMLQSVLMKAQLVGVGAAAAMVVGTAAVSESPAEFVENIVEVGKYLWEHPVISLGIFVIIVSLVLRFPDVVKAILMWIPGMVMALLKWVTKLVRKCLSAEKSEG